MRVMDGSDIFGYRGVGSIGKPVLSVSASDMCRNVRLIRFWSGRRYKLFEFGTSGADESIQLWVGFNRGKKGLVCGIEDRAKTVQVVSISVKSDGLS